MLQKIFDNILNVSLWFFAIFVFLIFLFTIFYEYKDDHYLLENFASIKLNKSIGNVSEINFFTIFIVCASFFLLFGVLKKLYCFLFSA